MVDPSKAISMEWYLQHSRWKEIYTVYLIKGDYLTVCSRTLEAELKVNMQQTLGRYWGDRHGIPRREQQPRACLHEADFKEGA